MGVNHEMNKLFYITLTIMMCAVSWPALSGQNAGLTNNDAPMLIMDIGEGSGDIGIGAGSDGYVDTVNTNSPIHTSHFSVVGSMDRSCSSTEATLTMLPSTAFRIEDPGRGMHSQAWH